MKTFSAEELENYHSQQIKARLLPVGELFNTVLHLKTKPISDLYGVQTSCWPVFNATFGGAREGELIIVTAETGAGKSTFIIDWFVDMARVGMKSCLMSFELSWGAISQMISQKISGKRFKELEDADLKKINNEMQAMIHYFYDHNGEIRGEVILKALEYGSRELGIKMFFVDHFDYIQKQWGDKNESYVIGDYIRSMAIKAKTLGITVVLICHPSKMNTTSGKRREVELDDLKGSSSLKQEADAIFSLFRPDQGKPITQLRYKKIRNHEFGKNVEGKIRFQFNPVSLTYSEISTGLEFGDA